MNVDPSVPASVREGTARPWQRRANTDRASRAATCYNQVMSQAPERWDLPDRGGANDRGQLDLAQLRHAGAALSRNRNFELYETPAARRLLRIHRWLRQLEQDLQRCAAHGEVRLLRPARGEPRQGASARRAHVLELVIPGLRFRRTVYLDEEELRLLQEEQPIAQILRVALR